MWRKGGVVVWGVLEGGIPELSRNFPSYSFVGWEGRIYLQVPRNLKNCAVSLWRTEVPGRGIGQDEELGVFRRH